MKKGDKVRFLNEAGGGIVAGFQSKNIVLVEDADGFQIPVSINEVVIVSDALDRKQGLTNTVAANAANTASTANADDDEPEETEPADREITFRKPAEERQGGNVLNLYLAFVPENADRLDSSNFDVYLVNDSNYFIRYTCATADGQNRLLRSAGDLEPNTKLLIAEINRGDLYSMEHTAIQGIAYKEQKSYGCKSAVDVMLHVEPLKLVKRSMFAANSFFDEDAMLMPIVKDDEAASNAPVEINSELVREQMMGGAAFEKLQNRSREQKPLTLRPNDNTLVVDLHADEILETTQGMNSIDILQYQLDVFKRTLNENAKNKGLNIVFIHGKGEGVLRKAIIGELHRHYKNYRHQDASFREYGYGATLVTIA